MCKDDPICSMLAYVLQNHNGTKPLDKEVVTTLAKGEKSELEGNFDELANLAFVNRYSKNKIGLKHTKDLVRYLYEECGWGRKAIENRVHHFTGDYEEIFRE